MPARLTATSDWQASYVDPIRFKRGETLRLIGKENLWDGFCWVWAVAPDGREGWVPDTCFEVESGTAIARADYSAMELSCKEGELLTAGHDSHGWIWCVNAQGEEGWLPARIMRKP